MRPANEWFPPDELARLYSVYLAVVAVPAVAFVAFMFVVAPPAVGGVFGVLTLAVVGFVGWWIPRFADAAAYRLGDEEVEYRRGVWFHKVSTVPYDRVTNVGTGQGPIQRRMGVGNVAVHTAGQGAQNTAELTVNAVADYEDVRDQVLERVRAREPVATEGADRRTRRPAADAGPGGAGGDADADRDTGAGDPVVAELRAIRALLEEDSGSR